MRLAKTFFNRKTSEYNPKTTNVPHHIETSQLRPLVVNGLIFRLWPTWLNQLWHPLFLSDIKLLKVFSKLVNEYFNFCQLSFSIDNYNWSEIRVLQIIRGARFINICFLNLELKNIIQWENYFQNAKKKDIFDKKDKKRSNNLLNRNR